MPTKIKLVQNRRDLKSFINFPILLHKDMKSFVPSLFMDEWDTLHPKKNPAYSFCKASLFLAYKDGKLAGRVAAIINENANETWNHKEVRFGWLDFIDDIEVSEALLESVRNFGIENGMTAMVGPLGFTDFDPEGMLVEGFDNLSTMVLHHNFPYYLDHMDRLGFTKEADWLEYKVMIPEKMPEKYLNIRSIIERKYKLSIKKLSKKEIKKKYGHKIFDLVNLTYKDLYNFTVLSNEMIDKYVNFYLGVLDAKFLTIVFNENDEVVGFGFSMPSITRALQKCKGKLFPFGWFHIIKSMYFKYEENIELLLIGVHPDYRNQGVTSLIFCHLFEVFSKNGFKYAETNAELEDNFNIRSQWSSFEHEQTKRRRVFKKEI